MEEKSRGLPDRVTLWAFALIVLIGGLNFVAVRFSNREIPPFFGAGIRFTIASLLLFAYMGASSSIGSDSKASKVNSNGLKESGNSRGL